MPKAFLLKKDKTMAEDLSNELAHVDVGMTPQPTQVPMNNTGGKN